MPATGGGSSNVLPSPQLRLDIRAFGAIEGPSHSAATRTAIQAAIDYIGTHVASNSWGAIYIPATTDAYYVSRSIHIDKDRIQILTDGQSSVVKGTTNYGGPIFIHGFSRNPLGQTLTSDHMVDLFGKLDTSAANASNQRWGIHCKQGSGNFPDSNVAFWSGPFQCGWMPSASPAQYWSDVRQFTIEFATDWTGLVPHSGAYFGMQREHAIPTPWFLMGGSSQLSLLFRTADGSLDGGLRGGPTWRADFTPGTTAAVRRFTIYVDLINGVVHAASDDTEVAVTISGGVGSFNSAANLSLTSSCNYPFKLGAMGSTANLLASPVFSYTGTQERVFCGLRISKGTRYNWNGIGQPITRSDAGSINDAYRYFTNDANVIALLPLQDAPGVVTGATGDRLITAQAGTGGAHSNTTHGVFTSEGHASNSANIVYCHIDGLRVEGGALYGPFGDALTLGLSLGVTLRNCSFKAGGHAIGSPNLGSNYITRVVDCSLWAQDSAIYNYFGLMHITSVDVEMQGRASFWFSSASTVTLHDCNAAGFFNVTSHEHYLICTGGSQATLTQCYDDIEGQGSSVSEFYFEDGGANPIGVVAHIEDFFMGTVTDDMPVVLTHESSSFSAPGRVSLNRLLLQGLTSGPLVQSDGTTFNFDIRTDLRGYQSDIFNHTGATGTGNGQSYHDGEVFPRAYNKWYAGSHELRNNAAADGQWTRWNCIGTGRMGTSAPPIWQGSAARDDGLNSLAAYFTGGPYWSVSGAKHGWWTDYANRTVLNGLFSGSSIPAAPTTVYLGLANGRALNFGYYTELSGNGYARVATSWNASSAGATANTGTLTFPTATANWTYRSLVLWDAATGGNQLAVIELATPATVLSGNALSFNAGAITLNRVPRTTSRPDAWADGFNDRINNYWLRSASLTPTSVYLALSTALADPTSSPTEPGGNGYTRIQLTTPNVPATFGIPAGGNLWTCQRLVNGAVKTFASASGSWGTLQSAALMDASSAGNVLASTNLTIPRTITTGSTAPSFGVNALWIQR